MNLLLHMMTARGEAMILSTAYPCKLFFIIVKNLD